VNKLIIPDIHLGARWDGVDRDKEILKFIRTIPEIVNQNQIKIVYFLGDIFESPYVSHSLVADFIEILNDIPEEVEIEILCGNHDGKPENTKGSPLQEIAALGRDTLGVTYGAYYEESRNELYLPYQTDPITQEQFKGMINSETVAFTHLDIHGAVPGMEREINRGAQAFLPDWVSHKCKKIYAGHIHKPQTMGNIEIVGSVIKANIAESDDVKKYIKIINGQEIHVPIKCRDIISFDIDYSTEEGQNIYHRLIQLGQEDTKKLDALMSVNIVCPHNLAHEIDYIRFKDSLRKKVHHLRSNFDVVKERNYRIKELDTSKSDIEIIETFVNSQHITESEPIIKNSEWVLNEINK